MPDFDAVEATDVWAAAARTLTDISAEEIFDLPILDAFTPSDVAAPSSSATADLFGSWVELIADVGEGKRVIGLGISTDVSAVMAVEIELGEGGSGSEAAIARVHWQKHGGAVNYVVLPVWKSLTDDARLAVRIRDDNSSARAFVVIASIG